MPETTLRRLTPADAPAYRALMLAAYGREPEAFTSTVAERAALPLAWWEGRLAEGDAPEQVLGAWAAGRLVGAAGLSREARARTGHRASVFGMVVEPEGRGQGLGHALLRALLDAARQMPGLRQLQLTVSEGNAPAIGLYQRCGFVTWGREPEAVALDDGRFITKLHMACELGAPARGFCWDDSEIAQVQRTATGWRLRLSAARVRQQATDGSWHEGHLAGLQIDCPGIDATPPDSLIGRLSAGRLIDARGRVWRELPVPGTLPGPLRLELQAARGESIELRLDAITLSAPPDARFTESLAC